MRYLLLCFFACQITLAYGQVSLDFTKRMENAVNGQDMTKKAIDGCVVLVKQSYQVKNKKNGKVFGRNGRKDFGHSCSIGVKTQVGLVLTDIALKPWIDDNAFKQVEKDYEPVISLTEIREIGKGDLNKFVQSPLRIGQQQPEGLWIADVGQDFAYTMEIDTDGGEKDGWIVWYTVKDTSKDVETAPVDMQTVSRKVYVENGKDLGIDEPIGDFKVLGGIYICPHYQGGGHVAYRLVGLMVNDDNRWVLRTPFVGLIFEQQEVASKQGERIGNPHETEEENVELTPIGGDNNSKNKKNKKSKK